MSMEFEKEIEDIEKRIAELDEFGRRTGVDMADEIQRLRRQAEEKRREIFADLTPWQRIQIARNPDRPDAMDYIAMICDDFTELHGDRTFGDDKALITGLCTIGSKKSLLIAQRKGRNTQERIAFNFGSPNPEGYRKAMHKMTLAEKFRVPIVSLVNTPGAYPGIGAEERGQAWAIAENLYLMSRLRAPILTVIIGEGGSGGALGICMADTLCILEHAYLSVISPEGCAAILWHDSSKAPQAAELLRLTPKDLKELGIIDDIVPEPLGGAHRDPQKMAETLRDTIVTQVNALERLSIDDLVQRRYAKYRAIGKFVEGELAKVTPS